VNVRKVVVWVFLSALGCLPYRPNMSIPVLSCSLRSSFWLRKASAEACFVLKTDWFADFLSAFPEGGVRTALVIKTLEGRAREGVKPFFIVIQVVDIFLSLLSFFLSFQNVTGSL
jgi:hypothetical protein